MVSYKWGPGKPEAPRQTTEEGAKGRKKGGSLLVVFACRRWREKGGNYKPYQLEKTPEHSKEGWNPHSQRHGWEHSPTASL